MPMRRGRPRRVAAGGAVTTPARTGAATGGTSGGPWVIGFDPGSAKTGAVSNNLINGTNFDSANISGVISNTSAAGGHGLDKVGPGTLVLSGNNTYTGLITLNSNNVYIGSDAGTLTLSGGINGGNDALTVVGAGNVTVSSDITGAGFGGPQYSVTKFGTGTLLLTGTNDFTGDIAVDAGTLQIGGGGAAGVERPGGAAPRPPLGRAAPARHF